MRQTIIDFLNRHPWIIGVLFAGMGLWELGHALFRYEQHNALIERSIRKQPWLIMLGWKIRPSRTLAVLSGLFFATIGLGMLDLPFRIMPVTFWLVAMGTTTIAALAALFIHKVKSWRRK